MMSDLSHLENGTEVYGPIGYDVYRDYDLLFDYKGKTLTPIDPDYTETFLKVHKAMRHIPLVNSRIGTANLKFGIDCGASSDLIDSGRWGEFKNMMKRVKTTKLKGVSNEEGMKVHEGKLKSLKIGGKTFRNTRTVFNSISHLNMNKDERIDGLIGYQILSRQKTILSCRNRKLIFIE